jgi:hypothetical protein
MGFPAEQRAGTSAKPLVLPTEQELGAAQWGRESKTDVLPQNSVLGLRAVPMLECAPDSIAERKAEMLEKLPVLPTEQEPGAAEQR